MPENKIEHKTFRFQLLSSSTKSVKGQSYGYIKGYASTFGNIDRGKEIVVRGAFTKTLEDYRQQGKLIPMCFQHSMMDMIGGFDPSKMHEDDKGLYVEGEINLDVERGKEVYALVKQGVIDSMSIGYTTEEDEIENVGNELVRKLRELKLWEISTVGVPMNPQARITDVKADKQEESVKINEFIGIISNRNMPLNEKKALVSQILRKNVLSHNAADYVMSFIFKDKSVEQKSDTKQAEEKKPETLSDAENILKETLLAKQQQHQAIDIALAKAELEKAIKR